MTVPMNPFFNKRLHVPRKRLPGYLNARATLKTGLDPKTLWLADVAEMLSAIELQIEEMRCHADDLENVTVRGRRLMSQNDIPGLEEIVAEMDKYLMRIGR